jgi:opacity protein-like surface antigen
MRKRMLVWIGCLSCLLLLMISDIAFSQQTGPYVSGNFGLTILTDSDVSDWSGSGKIEYDPGFSLMAAVGYNFGVFRAEGEIGYQRNDIDKMNACSGTLCASGVPSSGDLTALSFLVNGYYDFVNKSPFTPYFTFGIGVARLEINDFRVRGVRFGDLDDTVFAYQVGAGVGYSINKNFTIDLKYRYFATADPNFNGLDAEFPSQKIFLGLRFTF